MFLLSERADPLAENLRHRSPHRGIIRDATIDDISGQLECFHHEIIEEKGIILFGENAMFLQEGERPEFLFFEKGLVKRKSLGVGNPMPVIEDEIHQLLIEEQSIAKLRKEIRETRGLLFALKHDVEEGGKDILIGFRHEIFLIAKTGINIKLT
jgi:hypothetical protein